MLPFPPFDPAAIATEVDVVSSCHISLNSVSFCILQTNDVTTVCGTDSQEDNNVVDAVDAFKSYCTHDERAKH